MLGGVLQLSAVGKQDSVFILEPQVNIFKTVFKRYHNFAIQEIKQSVQGIINFGETVNVNISKSADLLSEISFRFSLPALSIPSGSTYIGWTNNIASVLVEEVTLEIGGQQIDKLFSVWLEIWNELTMTEDKKNAVYDLLGKFETVSEVETNATSATEYTIYFPFWFHKSPALALPIVALQYHEIKISLKLRSFSQCVVYDGSTAPTNVNITSGEIYCEYIFLEDKLRKLFAKSTHIYLIKQLQFTGKETINAIDSQDLNFKTRIEFNNRIKSLYWVLIESVSENNNDWFNFSRRSDTSQLFEKARILIDGTEREEQRDERYFRLTQPLKYHSHTTNKHIYMYSFSKYPEYYQGSGALNFSRLDHVYLELLLRANNLETNLYTFGLTENFLILQGGMSALAFLT